MKVMLEKLININYCCYKKQIKYFIELYLCILINHIGDTDLSTKFKILY